MLYSETELKKRLKSGCPVFYFYASDEALVRSAAAKAEKFLSEEAPDTTTLDGPTPSVEDIVLAAGTISFFGGRRLVMHRGKLRQTAPRQAGAKAHRRMRKTGLLCTDR